MLPSDSASAAACSWSFFLSSASLACIAFFSSDSFSCIAILSTSSFSILSFLSLADFALCISAAAAFFCSSSLILFISASSSLAAALTASFDAFLSSSAAEDLVALAGRTPPRYLRAHSLASSRAARRSWALASRSLALKSFASNLRLAASAPLSEAFLLLCMFPIPPVSSAR